MSPDIQRISIDYNVMLGKPLIRNTRITVELIMRKLSEGASHQQLLDAYPSLDEQDIYAALSYATNIIANEEPLNLG